jgi:hypothetical protein
MKKNVINETGRICTKCEDFKEWKFFYKRKGGFNGRNSICARCVNDTKIEKRKLKRKVPILKKDNIGRECSRCNEYKNWDQYYKKTGSLNNKDYMCSKCRKNISNKWKKDNNDKLVEYRQERAKDPVASERDRKRNLDYHYKNRDKNLKKFSEYSKKNKRWLSDKNKIYIRNYMKKRRNSDPQFKLTGNIKASLRYSLKQKGIIKKWNSFGTYFKFSIDELMSHLEKQFSDGMTWNNYGKWHIDHICPIADFTYQSHRDLEFIKCWDLENLRPLWAQDNWDKHDAMTKDSVDVRKYLDEKYS